MGKYRTSIYVLIYLQCLCMDQGMCKTRSRLLNSVCELSDSEDKHVWMWLCEMKYSSWHYPLFKGETPENYFLGVSKRELSKRVYFLRNCLNLLVVKREEGVGGGIPKQRGHEQSGSLDSACLPITMANQGASGFCWWKSLIAPCALVNFFTGIHSFSLCGNPFQWIK